MPGRAAPVSPAAVAALYAAAEPARGPFRQGLSAFPERPTTAVFNSARFGGYDLTPIRFGGYDLTPIRFGGYTLTPPRFGDATSVATDAAGIAAATAAGGPVGGGVAIVADLASVFSSGSARDAQRAARANYFGNLAVAGNVAAAQLILGALAPNVSGNELPMWNAWKNQLSASSKGQATLAAAQQLGPYWPVGSTDTVTNYPIMKNFAQTWANAHPFASATGVAGTVAAAASSPMVWVVGAAVIGGILLLRRRR